MGVGIVFLLVLVTMMIIPLSYALEEPSQEFKTDENRYLSYQEKQEKELDRLNTEYELKEPYEGGPHGVELVDFKKLAEDQLVALNVRAVDLQLTIDGIIDDIKNQNQIIAKEQIKIIKAQQKVQEQWGAAPVDETQIKIDIEKLNDLAITQDHLLKKQDRLEKQIELKKLLLEIQMYDAKLIGVKLSQNCITLAKLNSNTCPTYEDLLTLDSSNKEISGDFSMYDDYFHREPSKFTNSHQFYDTEDTIRIIVDPHQEISSRIKMITIEPNIGYYTDAYDRKLDDGLRTLSKDRIIDNCYNATISADNWRMLLPDTIFTFRNGCTSADITDQIKFTMPHTVIDKSTSPNVQYQEWLKETKNACTAKC